MKIAVFLLALASILISISIQEDREESVAMKSVYSKTDDRIINMCFFCDKHCRTLIEEKNSLDKYFKEIGDVITKNFHNSNLNITIAITDIYKFKKNIKMKKYSHNKVGKEQLPVVSENFWKHNNFYKSMKDKYDCGVAFLLQTFKDTFWKDSSKDGVSTLYGLCRDDGYGVVKLEGNDPRGTATLLTHELGHEMGMNHDNEQLDPSVFAMAQSPEYQQYVVDILKWCGPGKDNGCKDRSGACIMDPAPLAFSPYPSTFSECSIAYLEYFLTIPISLYDHGCIHKSD